MFTHSLIKNLSVVVATSLLFVATAPGSAAPRSPQWLDRVAIIINDDIITQSELKQRMQATRNNLRKQKIAMPPATALRYQVTDALILDQLQLQQAKKIGIDVTSAQIDATINDVARQSRMSRANFLAKIKRDKISVASLRSDLRRQLTIRQLINRVINSQIQVSEHEIDGFLADRTRQGVSAEFNLSHIVISVPPGASASSRKKAARLATGIRKKIIAGHNFENLAITHSKGPDALKGGALGWRKAGQLPDIFISALKNKSKGFVTNVLESPNGFHILRINSKRGGTTKTLVKQTHARHILLKPSAILSLKQARTTLIKLRQRILAGEDFAKIARKYSTDSGSASQGGDLGWTSPGQMVGEIEKAMNALKPGGLSQPVQSRFGIHLVQVLGRRSQDVGNQRQRMGVRQQIHARKADEKLREWLQELRSQAYIEILPN